MGRDGCLAGLLCMVVRVEQRRGVFKACKSWSRPVTRRLIP
jgi:hypothetical protein